MIADFILAVSHYAKNTRARHPPLLPRRRALRRAHLCWYSHCSPCGSGASWPAAKCASDACSFRYWPTAPWTSVTRPGSMHPTNWYFSGSCARRGAWGEGWGGPVSTLVEGDTASADIRGRGGCGCGCGCGGGAYHCAVNLGVNRRAHLRRQRLRVALELARVVERRVGALGDARRRVKEVALAQHLRLRERHHVHARRPLQQRRPPPAGPGERRREQRAYAGTRDEEGRRCRRQPASPPPRRGQAADRQGHCPVVRRHEARPSAAASPSAAPSLSSAQVEATPAVW
jgi:hypothetical protein